MLDHILGRPERARRLARDDAHFLNGAEGGGADRVEAQQGAGGEDDARARLPRRLGQVQIVEEGGAAYGHENAAGLDDGLSHGAEGGCGYALDDDVGDTGQFRGVHYRHGARQAGRCFLRLGGVASSQRHELEVRQAALDAARHGPADGAETGDCDFHFLPNTLYPLWDFTIPRTTGGSIPVRLCPVFCGSEFVGYYI